MTDSSRYYPVPDTPFGILEQAGDWVPVVYSPGDCQPLCLRHLWSNPARLTVELAALWAELTPDERAAITTAHETRTSLDWSVHPAMRAKTHAFLKTHDGGG